jgi:hypothetical protein
MKAEFTFDPVCHEYRLRGVKLMSNTELLDRCGLTDYSMVPPEQRMKALALGTAVHKATAMYDRNQNWRSFFRYNEEIIGYVEAWGNFKREMKFKYQLIETPLLDPVYLLATTPDRFGLSKYGWTTVQIKTGPVEDVVGLQLSFEERVIRISRGEPASDLISSDRRFGVSLRPDGTYKTRRFSDPQDIRVFLGALALYRWKESHGYK